MGIWHFAVLSLYLFINFKHFIEREGGRERKIISSRDVLWEHLRVADCVGTSKKIWRRYSSR